MNNSNPVITVKKMHYAQLRMMLDALGVPFNTHSDKTPEIRAMVQTFQDKMSKEDWDAVYNMVINHTVDTGKAPTVMEYSTAARLISDISVQLENNAIQNITNEFQGNSIRLVKDLQDAFSKQCAIEAKKYNTVEHVVKVGKLKPVKASGALPENFNRIISLATMRKNQLLVGPAGCGKTYIAAQVAEVLGLPFAAQSCSAGVTETTFTGRLLPLGKSGQFEYVESDFVRIFENGGVFLLDEFDAADPNVAVFLNMALANESFFCSQRLGNTLVKKHKDFVCIAAANTFGNGSNAMYSGRNAMDGATLDRFRCGIIEMDYSPAVEEAIIDAEVLAWGRKVRQAIRDRKLPKIFSTRFMKDASDMKQGVEWTLAEIANQYFCDWSKDELAAIGVFSEDSKVSRFV